MNDPKNAPAIRESGVSLGLAAVAIGLVGIFTLSFVLSPVAFILGALAILRLQIATGLLAILFSIVGVLTSPILMGIVGLGALAIVGSQMSYQ